MSLQLVQQTIDEADDKPASLVAELSSSNLDINIDPTHGTISRGGFKVNIVQNIVKSFGAIRMFDFARQEVDGDTVCSWFFLVLKI